MFAILETGGKQYRVSKGSIIDIERLNKEEIEVNNINNNDNNKKINFEKILFIQKDDNTILLGKPTLTGVLIEGTVISNYKDDKVIVFKKRRRKNSKRKNGHRQMKTKVIINDIKF